MITIPKLSLYGLNIEFKELTFEDSLILATMPPQNIEANTTAFLKKVVSCATIENVLDWTVQQRIIAVIHFQLQMHYAESGDFNFEVGNGTYAVDYFDFSKKADHDSVPIEFAGDSYKLVHLTGRMSESVERIKSEFNVDLSDAGCWELGCLSAQLIREGEQTEFSSDTDYDDFLLKKIKTFKAFPDTDLDKLIIFYLFNSEKLHHLVKLVFTEKGIAVLEKPKLEKPAAEGGLAKLSSAQFLIHSCLSANAIRLAK